MLDDQIDRLVGRKKSSPRIGGHPAKPWPILRQGALVATTAVASWTLGCSFCSPTENERRELEVYRTRPVVFVEAVESYGTRAGEMVLTIDLSNIGHVDSDISFEVMPRTTWATFGPQASIKVDPTMPVSARLIPGLARIRIPGPIVPGLDASVTIDGIIVKPPAKFKYEDTILKLDASVGKYPAWMGMHLGLHPSLKPAMKSNGAASADGVGSRTRADSAGAEAVR